MHEGIEHDFISHKWTISCYKNKKHFLLQKLTLQVWLMTINEIKFLLVHSYTDTRPHNTWLYLHSKQNSLINRRHGHWKLWKSSVCPYQITTYLLTHPAFKDRPVGVHMDTFQCRWQACALCQDSANDWVMLYHCWKEHWHRGNRADGYALVVVRQAQCSGIDEKSPTTLGFSVTNRPSDGNRVQRAQWQVRRPNSIPCMVLKRALWLKAAGRGKAKHW